MYPILKFSKTSFLFFLNFLVFCLYIPKMDFKEEDKNSSKKYEQVT